MKKTILGLICVFMFALFLPANDAVSESSDFAHYDVEMTVTTDLSVTDVATVNPAVGITYNDLFHNSTDYIEDTAHCDTQLMRNTDRHYLILSNSDYTDNYTVSSGAIRSLNEFKNYSYVPITRNRYFVLL